MTKRPCATADAQPLATALRAGALAAALALATCSAPAVEGYQVQAPPPGFLYAVNQAPGTGALSRRQAVSQGTWFGDLSVNEPRSTLEVTRYKGPATEGEAAAARAARVARVEEFGASAYNLIGPIRTRTLPDSAGTAWAWTEWRQDEYGSLRSLQVSEVVSFDTVSFSLVFDTEAPERMTEEHLDAVLATFALGRSVIHWRLIWAVAGVLAVLATLLGRRTRRTQPTDYGLWERGEAPKSPPSHASRDPGSAS